MKIDVASKKSCNPERDTLRFCNIFKNIEVIGIKVELGVADRPMSDVETYERSRIRAQ